MKQSLSVEIFRDVNYPDVDTDVALEGIDLINSVVTNLEIVQDTRRLRLGGEATESIRTENIRWPQLDHDLSIVLTRRELLTDSSNEAATKVGSALRFPRTAQGVAIVNVNSFNPAATIAHEAGHLLGAQYPEHAVDTYHCEDETCTMHATMTITNDVERVKKRGLSNWLERHGYRPADYRDVQRSPETTFCDSCRNQLSRRAFFLLEHKRGKFVPEEWR